MILVPMNSSGVKVERMLPVFGYDSAPHGHAEVLFENVRVPATNMIWDEGKGFAIAQGRLGPGRIHHCMRFIGMAERALEYLCKRVHQRETFVKRIAEHGVVEKWIDETRTELDHASILRLKAALMMDTVGNKAAKAEIAMSTVVAPNVATPVIDVAIQAFGGGGV